jgi:hypothetical protein
VWISPPLLSRRQEALVAAVERLTAARGFAPSLRELADELRVHPSRIGQLVASTAAKGRISHVPRVARSLRVIPPTDRRSTPSTRG